MNFLVIILLTLSSFVLSIFQYREMPECEKSKQPPNTFIENCCPTLPRYNNKKLFIACKKMCDMWLYNPTGEGSRKCCMINCTYFHEGIMKKYGSFEPKKMIEVMRKKLTYNNSWSDIIETVINNCTQKAMVLEMDDILSIPAQCETSNITIALNITHCIRREMIFNCKDESMKLPRCKSLIEFGKGCSYWPWQCNHKRKHTGDFKMTPKPPGTEK